MGIASLVRRARVGLAAAGPAALTFAREAGRRRHGMLRAGGIAAVLAVAALAVTAVLAVFQLPVIIADIAADTLFGSFETSLDRPPADFCVPIPEVAQTPAPSAAAAEELSDAQSLAPIEPLRESAVGPDGKATAAAHAIIAQVPVGAEVDVTTAWVLFRLAHPGDESVSDYRLFGEAYASSRGFLSAAASPLDVVSTMDPRADYGPYLLVAQSATYRLVRQGTVAATDEQARSLVTALAGTCTGPGHSFWSG